MRDLMRVAAMVAVLAGSTALADVFHDYEDLAEGFYGETFQHAGVTFRDVNRVSGMWPSGDTFGPDGVDGLGNENIIENATLLYDDFPDFGSRRNGLTFGRAFIPGDNLSVGALASVWMDLEELGNAASLEIAYFERGPWGGIEYHLDALRNDTVVASDSFVIAGGGGRDAPAVNSLSVTAAEFDTLHLYATYNGSFSGPRGLIDDLSITAVPEPGTLAGLLGLAMVAAGRRRG